MLTVGFAGTAKNTGKTTTAVHMLEQARQAGLSLALTSIGYDGENRDNITGLPKPRYMVEAGDLVATARGCLKAGTADFAFLADTGVRTILGPVVLARVTTKGTALLAGPNREQDIQRVLACFRREKVDFCLLDGALNRIVPMSAADGLVLSTGAAFEEENGLLAHHACAMASLFRLPKVDGYDQLASQIQWWNGTASAQYLNTGSMLSKFTLDRLISCLPEHISRLVIPGACDASLVQELFARCEDQLSGAELVLGSPLRLIASSDPVRWNNLLAELNHQRHRVSYLEIVPLRLMTVNPFYPAYQRSQGEYTAAYVDAPAQLAAVRVAIPWLPVVNIRLPHDENLLATIGLKIATRSGKSKGHR